MGLEEPFRPTSYYPLVPMQCGTRRSDISCAPRPLLLTRVWTPSVRPAFVSLALTPRVTVPRRPAGSASSGLGKLWLLGQLYRFSPPSSASAPLGQSPIPKRPRLGYWIDHVPRRQTLRNPRTLPWLLGDLRTRRAKITAVVAPCAVAVPI